MRPVLALVVRAIFGGRLVRGEIDQLLDQRVARVAKCLLESGERNGAFVEVPPGQRRGVGATLGGAGDHALACFSRLNTIPM